MALMGCTIQGPIQLEGVEVRDYEGEDLSSINDFRENSILGPQYVNIDDYELIITGLVDNASSLSYNEVLNLQSYTKVVTLYCVEGWDVKLLWEGILVKDLLEQAGIKEEANTVIFKAYDGYTTSLSLDYVTNNNILLAYKMNNVTLPPARGFPFQLVAEDKWGYKWIKWVTEIELSNNTDYQGFWESRGFNDNGSIYGPKLS
jgi:DMSO/TMAO reductase YedYZ molybdopterin-dependent catalytic subunit